MKERTAIVVSDSTKVNPVLLRWMKEQPNAFLASEWCSFKGRDLRAVELNMIATAFLETDFEWLLLVDADIYPTADIDKLLIADYDVAGCAFVGKDSRTTHGTADGIISVGCMKISRRALEKIERPWFKFELTHGGTRYRCECVHFCEKALAAGFHPLQIGVVGHCIPMIVLPVGKDEKQIAVKFPSQWDLSKETKL